MRVQKSEIKVVVLLSKLFFAVLVAVAVVVAQAPYCCDPKILLPRQREVTLLSIS